MISQRSLNNTFDFFYPGKDVILKVRRPWDLETIFAVCVRSCVCMCVYSTHCGCMCLSECECVHMCVFLHIFTSMCTSMCSSVYLRAFACVCVCLLVSLCTTCVCVRVCEYVWLFVCMGVRARVCVYVFMCGHVIREGRGSQRNRRQLKVCVIYLLDYQQMPTVPDVCEDVDSSEQQVGLDLWPQLWLFPSL